MIDIGTPDTFASRLPRLCFGRDLVSPTRYVTLSHCWGQHAILTKLSGKNILSLMKGIEFSNLTKTFQDAILIVQELGLRYLWIDSLCIIQDSQEDWLRESSLMTQVFSSSLFNIAATAAEDGSIGLFFQRNALEVRPTKATINIKGIPSLHFFVNFNFCSALEGPLSKRGWVVQERLMSPGNLHFTRNQIFWECRESLACETFPTGIPLELDIPSLKGEMARALGTSSFLDQRKVFIPQIHLDWLNLSPLKAWKSIVEHYTSSTLSYRTDKLVAIGGLARMVQMILKSEYFAGLWQEGFADQLLWYKDPPPTAKESLEYVAPSWSWAASNSRCKFAGRPQGVKTYPILDIIEINLEHVSENLFGQVTTGYLKVTSKLAKAKLLSEQILPERSKRCGLAIIYTGDGNLDSALEVFWELSIELDVRVPESQFVEEIVYFLPVNETEYIDYAPSDFGSDAESDTDSDEADVSKFGERESVGITRYYMVNGLVLKPCDVNFNEFTRHGIFSASRKGVEKLRDGFRYFDRIAEESGLEYIEDVGMERKYLFKIL
jgi:Heterokaryon incompatibility protein (HET)